MRGSASATRERGNDDNFQILSRGSLTYLIVFGFFKDPSEAMPRYLKCSSFTNFSCASVCRKYPNSILSLYLGKARHVIAPHPARCSRVSREKTWFSSREIKVGNKSPGLVGVVNLTLTSLECSRAILKI